MMLLIFCAIAANKPAKAFLSRLLILSRGGSSVSQSLLVSFGMPALQAPPASQCYTAISVLIIPEVLPTPCLSVQQVLTVQGHTRG